MSDNATSTPPKIKVGIFTFTCSEDSSIMLTVLLNDYFLEWKKRLEFVEGRILRKQKSDQPLDVALVEGAITSDEQAQELKTIRNRTKTLIAIGSCAVTGMPSAQRNDFDQKTKKEIEFVLDRFKYNDRVQKISDIVPVDGAIPGCPMNTDLFLQALDKLFVEYGFTPVLTGTQYAPNRL